MQAAWIVVVEACGVAACGVAACGVAGCGFQAQVATLDDTGGALPAPDASFDFASCPEGYTTVLPGPSRYRLISTGGRAGDQSDGCNRDAPGATHLVVLDSMAEIVAVAALVDGAPDNSITHNAIWVGGVQLRSATNPADQWLGFDDKPLIDQWAPNEPNDGGGNEFDHGEQFVLVERGRHYLTDASGNTQSGALCECDGKPVAAMAAAAIAASR